MSTITVNDLAYRIPLKPRITIKDLQGNTNFVFDGFATPGTNPFNLVYVDMDNRVGETGNFNIIIEDSGNLIDNDLLRDTKVLLELGKSTDSYQYFLTGYAQKFHVRNPRSFYQEYLLSGYGSWIKSNHLFLQRRQTLDKNDPNAQIWKVIKNAFSNKNWRPENDVSIKDIVGWVDTGVSDEVNIPHSVINVVYQKFGEFMAQLSDESGASIFLDMSQGEPEILTAKYDPSLHTGVNIKAGNYWNVNDSAARNAYMKEPIEIQYDSSQDAGVASRLHSVTIIDSLKVAGSTDNKGSETLNNRALAQQCEITADVKHINSIHVKLRKIGDPESPKSRVNGDLCLDNNNTPTGQVIATFSIPLSSIEDNSQDIFVSDLDVKERYLTGNVMKIWLRLFQRSGIDGNAQNDPANTVAWAHNGQFNTVQSETNAYRAKAPGGDFDDKSTLDWSPTNKGPTFCFGIYSHIRLLHSRTSPRGVQQFGQIEEFIDSSGLENPADVNRFLAVSLQYIAKTRIYVPEFQCSIPNDFLFRPYQVVTFIHPKLTQDLRVLGVRYVCSALGTDPAIGALDCNVTLGGSYNPLIANCGCL